MKQILLKMMLVVSGLLISIGISAYDFTVDGLHYNLISLGERTVSLAGAASFSGNIVVPSTITVGTYVFNVISIDASVGSYSPNSGMTSLTISDGIKTIGNSAFYSVEFIRINFLKIPKSITSLGQQVFGCMVPTEIYLEDVKSWCDIESFDASYHPLGLAYNANKLWGRSVCKFYVNGIKSSDIEIPEGVTRIPRGAFSTTNITSVKFPSSLKSVDGFSGSFMKYVYFNSYNDTISSRAFFGCENLVSVSHNNVKYLGAYAFSGCKSLSSFVINEGVENIFEGTFSNCSSLAEIIIPSSCKTIGKSAFYLCSNVDTLILGNNVISIDNSAFDGCASLQTVICRSKVVPVITSTTFTTGQHILTTLIVPSGMKIKYQEADYWKEFLNIVENDNIDDLTKKCDFSLSSTKGGTVSIFGNTLTNTLLTTSIKKGEYVFMQFTSNEDYYLKSLLVNGEEMVNNVVDNNYTINSVTENTTVVVTFAELPTYLAIKNADNGSVSIVVEKGNAYTTVITPSRGWEVNTVSFNGTDVTSELVGNTYTTPSITEDSEITIVYKQTSVNGVRSSIESLIKVSASHGKVIIENNDKATTTSVYSTNGVMITTEHVGLGTTKISLDTNKIYIIKVGSETFKVAL